MKGSKRKHADAGRRLHAARLAAGEYEVSQLLRNWPKVNDATYRATEKGRRRASDDLLALATHRFKVSIGYLATGETSTTRDEEAKVIEAVLLVHEKREFGMDGEGIAARLRRMRLAAGFRSARAAASRFGWKIQRYGDHEGRRRGISFDQAIRYWTSFQTLPLETLILGTPKSDRSRSESASVSVVEDTQWGWLHVPPPPGLVRWPVVVLNGGHLRRLENPISIPVDMVHHQLRGAPGYCVVDVSSLSNGYLIVPSEAGYPQIVLRNGRLERNSNSDEERGVVDPLTLEGDGGAARLGVLVATLSIKLEF